MHEVSIAHALLETVLRHTRGRIIEIVLQVGELRMLNEDALTFAFNALAEGTRAEGAKLKLVRVPARLRCRRCGAEWSPREELDEEARVLAHFGSVSALALKLRCPRCGSTDFDIVRGLELDVVEIKAIED